MSIKLLDFSIVINIGSKKKARSFDFMEMFKEARQTAMDRNQGIVETDFLTDYLIIQKYWLLAPSCKLKLGDWDCITLS